MMISIKDSFTQDVNNLIAGHIKVGSQLVFRAVESDLKVFKISNFSQQYKIISVVPSVDTPVCHQQTTILDRWWSPKIAQQAILITISNDLPFAQKRSCTFANARNGHYLVSDYLFHEFAQRSGLLMKPNGLLCRALLILDSNNKVLFVAIANPVVRQIDFQTVKEKLKTLGLLT